MTPLSISKWALATSILIAALTPANAQYVFNSTSYTQQFNSIGTAATAALPTGWAFSSAANYTALATATTLAAGTTGTGTLTGTSSGGYYNFADGVLATSTDHAIGFMTSGSVGSPRYLYFAFTNTTGSALSGLSITFDIEKYRSGSRAFDIGFSTSGDASTWTAQSSGSQSFAADANNTVINNPPTFTSKSVDLTGLNIADGATFYLRWSYTGNGGSSNAQALGIDNFTLNATLAASAVPEPSTYAALAGVLALAGVMIQRRRRRDVSA